MIWRKHLHRVDVAGFLSRTLHQRHEHLCDRSCGVRQEIVQWTAARRAMERWTLQLALDGFRAVLNPSGVECRNREPPLKVV